MAINIHFKKRKALFFPGGHSTFSYRRTRKQSEYKQQEENNYRFDWYPRQKCFKKTTKQFLQPVKKNGQPPPKKKRKKKRVQHFWWEIHARDTEKHRNIEEYKRHKRRRLQGYFMPIYAYFRTASRDKWIQRTECKLWAHEKCPDGSPTLICSNC